MIEHIIEEAVEWNPELSPERQARVALHRDRFAAVGALFRKTRQILEISQVEAARRLDMTQANVSKIEKRGSADLAQLEKLAAGSGFEVVVLLKQKGSDRQIVLTPEAVGSEALA